MKSWFTDRQDSMENYADIMKGLHVSVLEEDDIREFFTSLSLLKGLSLPQMVPDESMLPMESLRVFYIDPCWVSCLLDGALSIGRNCSKDMIHDETELVKINETAESGADIRTGFLLRSQIISGWPGLEVRCFSKGTALAPVRLEILGGNVMFCIVDGELDEIELTEPGDALYFGVEKEQGRLVKELVSLKEQEVGKSLGAAEPVVFRDEGLGVIDVAAFAENMDRKLRQCGGAGEYFSSLEFAAEMIKERVRMKITFKGGEEDG